MMSKKANLHVNALKAAVTDVYKHSKALEDAGLTVQIFVHHSCHNPPRMVVIAVSVNANLSFKVPND